MHEGKRERPKSIYTKRRDRQSRSGGERAGGAGEERLTTFAVTETLITFYFLSLKTSFKLNDKVRDQACSV